MQRDKLTRDELIGDKTDMKNCPSCAEPILAAAIRCKHCGQQTSEMYQTGMSLVRAGLGFGIFFVAVWIFFNM